MSQVQEVKERVSIANLVGNYVELKSTGSTLKALCPFHQEKSPSFVVNEERQVFKCFGCGEGGDVFTFLEKIEGFNFREALEYLAEKVGIVLKQVKQSENWHELKDQKTRVYKLNQASSKFFNHLLINHPSGENALGYLENRGLSRQTIEDFQVGYAPNNYQLKNWLFKYRFNDLDLANAGRPERFRDRVIFPLKDALGNVVGFTGRSLNDENQPKYLNSPETAVFKKNKNIYGLVEGKDAIRVAKSIVLVEGQMDVIAAHQAGFKNVVACSGTALTPDHLKILRRYSEELVLMFDNDAAGYKATLKAIEIAQPFDFNLKSAILPSEFKDADELIKKDPDKWQDIIASSKPALENVILQEVGSATGLDINQKKAIAKKILPLIGLVQNHIEKSHYLNFLGTLLGVPEKALADALSKTKLVKTQKKQEDNQPQSPQIEFSTEEELIALISLNPNIYQLLNLGKNFFKANEFANSIDLQLIAWYDTNKDKSVTTNLIDFIKKSLSTEGSLRFDLLLSEIQKRHADAQIEQIATELCDKIKSRSREDLKTNLALQIKLAEDKGDRQRVKELVVELQKSLM